MAETAEGVIGKDVARIDGARKVTGAASYGSDFALPDQTYAFLVTSTIARGRIRHIDETAARRVPGVIGIYTHRDIAGKVKAGKLMADGGYLGTSIQPLTSPDILHDGQIVAVVIGESFESAREGAYRLDVAYERQPASASFDDASVETVAASEASKTHEDPKVGDAETAFQQAALRIDVSYSTPTQHHNPIELFTTLCHWSDGKLTVWESSQNVWGYKYGLAEQLGIDPNDIRVLSPFIGGAFGSRGSLTPRTAIIAEIARQLGRPVKLVPTRDQGFTIATYRAETRHHVKLGATPDGKLVSLSHEAWEVTSRPDNYMVSGTKATTRLYQCPNIYSKVSITHADRNTPGFMRSPPELPYLFALESAMDELAVATGIDPIELRRINDTQVEPIKGLPYTSRSLMACFDAGAKAFGWHERNPKPGAMRDGDWLVGWGCASTMYPTAVAPAAAKVRLMPDGKAIVQTAAHDIGTGAYTVIGQVAAERLGLPLANIEVQIGDSDLPPAPVAGGSNTTASVCNVVAKACDRLRQQLFQQSNAASATDISGMPLDAVLNDLPKDGIEAYAENLPHGTTQEGIGKLYHGHSMLAGGSELKDRIQFAFGAEFVELRIHRLTKEIRCSRLIGAFACGRIVNPRTARSQLMGGLIWGLSSALHEETEIDQASARYYNDDLAEYLIPVNADVREVEVIFVPEEDKAINDLGIKGLGELGNVGTNAAVANAVYHATGFRIRDLPIRLEDLLAVES
ncbi:MAG: xanthine dehydrogenase family protein molybdopterin-binding subunit [Rhodospirillaceae bacterium]|nr:MAG: xanthine dehydrogenase family protein molybdopterin-binding subunit [Rhodospirillaceae bacterium]